MHDNTLLNPVRVPDNLTTPTILRLLIEGPLRPWQFLMYLEASLPLYVEDLLALHMLGPNYVLLQIVPHYKDLDGNYCGGGMVEEEEENRE